MRININRQDGIITLPNDFAVLEDITKEGRFRYAIKFNVDIPRAVKENAFLVKIHASLQPPDVKDVPGFTQLNSQEVIKNLLTRQAESTEMNRAFLKNLIATVTSDITSKIPNDKTKELKPTKVQKTFKNYDDAKLTAEKYLFRKRGFKLVKAFDLTVRNVSQPIFQTPLFQPTVNEIVSLQPPQEYGFDLILKHGIDPAQMGNKTTQVVDAEKAYAGVLQRPRGSAREAVIGSPVGAVKPAFGILNTILGDSQGKPSNQLGLSNNDYAHVQVEENTNIVTIEEDLYLDVSAVGDQFYLIFELQDVNGVETESISTVVHHARNLSVFTLPVQLPFVSATCCTGYNRLELKQVDPNGAGVFIYRKILNTHSAATEADFVQIAKMPLRTQDGSKWYNDLNPGMQPVIYRVVTYNRSELKSHDFASVVVNPPQRAHMVRSHAQQKKLFISISTKVVGKTIQIELNDPPPGVLTMKVFRLDLTRHEKLSEATQVGNAVYIQKLPTPNSRFYVTDTAPVDQRIYDYRVKLTFRDGTEFWSSSSSHIQFNPIVNNVITTTSTPIKAANVGNELDVVFSLSSAVTEGKMDQVKKAMEQQGILGFYQSDIIQNRDQLQNLIAYQIKRTNLTTGEIEDMGVFIGKDFSDNAVGHNLGVKKVQVGHAYEYTINTHFRSAQSLISTFTATVTNSSNPDRTYSYAPSKWQHPVTLRDGNLVSTTSLKRNHASTDFTFGTVGDILHIRISLTLPVPAVQKATVSPLGKGKVLLQWELKGNPKQIDHFLVMKEEMGMRTLAGKVHALTDTRSLQFIDTPSLPEVTRANPARNLPLSGLVNQALETAVTYHVIPVLHDLSHGPATKSSQTITKKLR